MDGPVLKYVKEAKKCLFSQNYGKAYAFYLLVLKLCPQMQRNVAEEFSAAWREWSTQLRDLGRVNDLFSLYEQGCEVFVQCEKLHFHMGNALFQLDMKLEAVNMFRKALIINEHFFEASVSLENACRGIIDSWHFTMLNDKQRNRCFEAAISHSIKSNQNILDIGSGTGILSMLAVRHGANNVTACEMSETLHSVAAECLVANDMKDEINLECCHSSQILSKMKNCEDNNHEKNTDMFSLVITETVDAGLLGEGIIDILSHAWKHLLYPPSDGGRVIPHSATLFCCLIECETIHKKHVLVGKPCFPGVLLTSGVGISAAKENSCVPKRDEQSGEKILSANVGELEPYTSETLKNVQYKKLTEPLKMINVNFNDPNLVEAIAKEEMPNLELRQTVIESGYVDGVAVWFELKLEDRSDAAVINTGIGSLHCWDQAVYPLRSYSCLNSGYETKRINVIKQDVFSTSFQVRSDCLMLQHAAKESFGDITQYPQSFLDFKPNLHITLLDEQMQRLNDSSFSNLCYRAICKLNFIFDSSCNFLDISNGFDLFAIKTAQTSKMKVHKYCQTNSIYSALSSLSKQCKINIDFYQRLPLQKEVKFDLIFFHVIEPSGLLSPNAISNICSVKPFLSERGLVVPNHVTLMVQCVESHELLSKCMVQSDDNTLGLKIAETINDFRVSVHSDLDLNSLNFTPLSEAYEILNWDFNATDVESILSVQKSIVIKAIERGALHAVLFWFRFRTYGDDFLDTSSATNHWKQAAYVFAAKKQLSLVPDDEVVLNATSRDDSILFRVSKYGA